MELTGYSKFQYVFAFFIFFKEILLYYTILPIKYQYSDNAFARY